MSIILRLLITFFPSKIFWALYVLVFPPPATHKKVTTGWASLIQRSEIQILHTLNMTLAPKSPKCIRLERRGSRKGNSLLLQRSRVHFSAATLVAHDHSSPGDHLPLLNSKSTHVIHTHTYIHACMHIYMHIYIRAYRWNEYLLLSSKFKIHFKCGWNFQRINFKTCSIIF